MAERKAVIKTADMSEDMQQDAVDCASQVRLPAFPHRSPPRPPGVGDAWERGRRYRGEEGRRAGAGFGDRGIGDGTLWAGR